MEFSLNNKQQPRFDGNISNLTLATYSNKPRKKKLRWTKKHARKILKRKTRKIRQYGCDILQRLIEMISAWAKVFPFFTLSILLFAVWGFFFLSHFNKNGNTQKKRPESITVKPCVSVLCILRCSVAQRFLTFVCITWCCVHYSVLFLSIFLFFFYYIIIDRLLYTNWHFYTQPLSLTDFFSPNIQLIKHQCKSLGRHILNKHKITKTEI